jgi:hypothetical protein
VREFFTKKILPELPALAKSLDVKVLLNIHLDPGHKALALFEAPNAEAVRDLLVRGGFMHFVDMEFHLVTPIEELAKNIDKFPTIY